MAGYDDGYPKDDMFGEGGRAEARPVALAVVHQPLSLDVREVEHDDAPEGAVCVGTFLDGRRIARTWIATSRLAAFLALFEEPRPLFYEAMEKEDKSIEGTLSVLVPFGTVRRLVEEAEAAEEPWKASVPTFDGEWSDRDAADEVPEDAMMPIPIGTVVRIAARREHPEDLAQEAAAIMQRVVEGKVIEIVDQLLDSL